MGESMVRLQLDDRKWAKIAAFLAERRGPGRRGNDNRKFVEAVLWWRRTGVPWRESHWQEPGNLTRGRKHPNARDPDPSPPIGHPPRPLPLSGTGTGRG